MPELKVRLERKDEWNQIGSLVTDAFGDSHVADLLNALRASTAWRDLSFVAEIDGALAAHMAFTRGWLDAPTQLVEVLILSPMSVAPEWQRQGIGKELIRKTIKLLAKREEPLIFLEGNPRFYSQVGFLPGGPAGFIRPSLRIPEAAFQYLPLPSYKPWMTGTLVYPEVFWAMDCVGLRG